MRAAGPREVLAAARADLDLRGDPLAELLLHGDREVLCLLEGLARRADLLVRCELLLVSHERVKAIGDHTGKAGMAFLVGAA